jgi:hypothetical protein
MRWLLALVNVTLSADCTLPLVPNRTIGLLLVSVTVLLDAGRAFSKMVAVAVNGPIPAAGTIVNEVIRNGPTVKLALARSSP